MQILVRTSFYSNAMQRESTKVVTSPLAFIHRIHMLAERRSSIEDNGISGNNIATHMIIHILIYVFIYVCMYAYASTALTNTSMKICMQRRQLPLGGPSTSTAIANSLRKSTWAAAPHLHTQTHACGFII